MTAEEQFGKWWGNYDWPDVRTYNTDAYNGMKAAFLAGVQAERERVVKYLREQGTINSVLLTEPIFYIIEDDIAAIERGGVKDGY